jgi:23S rRNA (cytosine1962-C5)-methyltransferase
LAEVRVNRKAADRIASGHPWVFATDVADRADAAPGDAVFVFDPKNRPLGTFHYSSTSQIALRQLSPRQENIDRDFFVSRIGAALEHRKRVVHGTDAYRLVFGEADLLPALVIDRYSDVLVIQTLSQGMDRAKQDIVVALGDLLAPRAIVERNDVSVRRHEGLPLISGVITGDPAEPVEIVMNGLRWGVDLLGGQKTGIYLDQRENYLAAAQHACGDSVLDCFTSTGGFALHLARVCERVEAVDSSGHALAAGAANAERNAIANVQWREADVFQLLASYAQAGKRFGTIVLDPPAFAKSRGAVEGAARGYKEINYRALRLLEPGGVLVTCSCSHHFGEAMLLQTAAEAALDAGRTLRVLERRMQASDHPVLLTVPETLYLKCLILEAIG